ncbi:MAG: protein kinase [Eubacterium sp.]|nr:protein kinase [Eubacterium sp.]
MERCMKCMARLDNKRGGCPECGALAGETSRAAGHHLKAGSRLGGKYLVGLALADNSVCIKYIGLREADNKKVIIEEYYPKNLAVREGGEALVRFRSQAKNNLFAKGLGMYISDAKKIESLPKTSVLCRIFDILIENNTGYVVWDYEDGKPLSKHIKKPGSFTVENISKNIKAMLETLNKLHSQGIVHGNISPDHIFVSRTGKFRLMDFGVGGYVNSTGFPLYNPHYSPCEARGEGASVDAATDVYSMAGIYYKLLTGVTPFDAEKRRNGKKLPGIRELGIRAPKGVDNAVMNGLNLNPACRYKNAGEFLKALQNRDTKRIKDDFGENTGSGTGIDLKRYILPIGAGILAGALIIGLLSFAGTKIIASKFSGDKAASGAAVETTEAEVSTVLQEASTEIVTTAPTETSSAVQPVTETAEIKTEATTKKSDNISDSGSVSNSGGSAHSKSSQDTNRQTADKPAETASQAAPVSQEAQTESVTAAPSVPDEVASGRPDGWPA